MKVQSRISQRPTREKPYTIVQQSITGKNRQIGQPLATIEEAMTNVRLFEKDRPTKIFMLLRAIYPTKEVEHGNN